MSPSWRLGWTPSVRPHSHSADMHRSHAALLLVLWPCIAAMSGCLWWVLVLVLVLELDAAKWHMRKRAWLTLQVLWSSGTLSGPNLALSCLPQ